MKYIDFEVADFVQFPPSQLPINGYHIRFLLVEFLLAALPHVNERVEYLTPRITFLADLVYFFDRTQHTARGGTYLFRSERETQNPRKSHKAKFEANLKKRFQLFE